MQTKSGTRSPRLTSCVYFAACDSFIKIGVAKDPYQRVKVLATACPYEVRLVGAMLGDEEAEAVLHRLFAKLKHRNEWFRHEEPLSGLVSVVASNDHLQPRWLRGVVNRWVLDADPLVGRRLAGPHWTLYDLDPSMQGQQPA